MWGRAQAIIEDMGLPKYKKMLLYREAASHTCKMDRFTIISINGVKRTRYKYLFGHNPHFVNHLRVWGESWVVKEASGRKRKLANWGHNRMFVQHAKTFCNSFARHVKRFSLPPTKSCLVSSSVMCAKSLRVIGSSPAASHPQTASLNLWHTLWLPMKAPPQW